MTPALEVANLNKRFGGLPATKQVSLSVMPGERRLIIGPNGAGKTTLFNLITGDLTPDAGSVKLFGQELLVHSEERGPLTDAKYVQALQNSHRLSRDEGIDRVMQQQRLDALVAPTSGIPARVGAPPAGIAA